ncbi:MAG TPA: hypothetical protein VG496_07220 [Myxococcales bacterium]|nr:hypothetical protein [Myxococcales bacterium]
MADKPKDLKPAMEHGEVKVIKNERPRPARRTWDPGKTPGAAETGRQADEPTQDPAGKTPGNAEG